MGWVTEGLKDRPLRGGLLADTTGMLAASLKMAVVVKAKKACEVDIVLRDALNATDVSVLPLYCDQGTTRFPLPSVTFLAGQRLIVRCNRDVDDEIQATIIW
jgi:hypothetical protein